MTPLNQSAQFAFSICPVTVFGLAALKAVDGSF